MKPQQPLTRHTLKRPIETAPQQQTTTSTSTTIPHPKGVKPTTDYWIKEGHLWKRARVQPQQDLYTPQQADDGPDIFQDSHTGHQLSDDDWTTKRRATIDTE